ncbi:MAG TPA: hypothetical protein VFT99_12805 [Roseiflexaceae bacterium]|nr:hypothetical protein [Roseiflexaceae bacterium]
MPTLAALHARFMRAAPLHKRRVHIRLCRHALRHWEAYAAAEGPIEYVDSVIGMHHSVEAGLPHEALECVLAGRDLADVGRRYWEPIVAMQDDDLAFPGGTTLAYYAIYNLFRKYVEHAPIDNWLIVNQAISCEDDPQRWARLLACALRSAALRRTM